MIFCWSENKVFKPKWLLIVFGILFCGTSISSAELVQAERRIYASRNEAIIALDNGLSSVRCEAFCETMVAYYSSDRLATNFSEIWIKMRQFSYKNIRFKLSSAKCKSFCLGLNIVIPQMPVPYLCVLQAVTLDFNCHSQTISPQTH